MKNQSRKAQYSSIVRITILYVFKWALCKCIGRHQRESQCTC